MKLKEQKTNRPIKGWVSTDRSVEAALLNTTPWPVAKSYASDFTPRSVIPGMVRFQQLQLYWITAARLLARAWYASVRLKHKCASRQKERVCIVAVTRWDSDLEAFSHKPSDGSFAPLACRPSTWTNCLNLRFLSYWAGLLLQQRVISRVKLTCLTTV